MKSRKKIKLVAFIVLQCLVASSLFSQTTSEKKNVIFICIDDLSIAFDAYDNPQAPAPNFARLMQHGVLFKQTYAQYPLCSPSRTSLLSGKRPDSTGVFHNWIDVRTVLGPDYRFLPEYFHDYGYRTERYGKTGPCGHEDAISWDFEYKGPKTDILGFQDTPGWWVDTVHKTREETRDGIFTDGLINTLEHSLTTPAFYSLGMGTHNPFTPILTAWDHVGDSSTQRLVPIDPYGTITNVYGNGSANIVLPDTPPDDDADIPPVALKGLLDYTPEQTQDLRHAYYSEMTEMDDNLGKLLDALDSIHAWQNSVIVFWSDHGLHMGEHGGLWLKMTLFEESLRVPFVICAPGKQKNVVCNSPVELVDIYPTLAELCGLPKPEGMEGSSLVPLLENPNAQWKKAIFSQRVVDTSERAMGYTTRTSRYQYNYWNGEGEELYDIENDPFEYVNLAENHPEADSVLNAMRALFAGGWVGALPPAYTRSTFYKDNDGDGYGTSNDTVVSYFRTHGYASKKGDCNDNDPDIHPSAPEKTCNGIDDNCNGKVDENRPKPEITVIGNLDICQTGNVLLKTNANSDLKYQWTRNGANIPGANKGSYTATKAGKYQAKVLYQPKECGNISDPVTVTNSCLQKISISPNPSQGILNIAYYAATTGNIQLTVDDKTGKILFSKIVAAIKGNNTIQVNLSNLIDGFYTLQLNNGEEGQANFVIAK